MNREVTNAEHACCTTETASAPVRGREHAQRLGLWSTVVAVLSAAAASACCWLPLLLLAVGVSAAGAGSLFETTRPYFLAGAAVFLAVGFYLNYFRKPACALDGTCATPNPKVQRFNRVMLWIACAVVLALALFPSYVGALLALNAQGSDEPAPVARAAGTQEFVFSVSGMTCEACASGLQAALSKVPGVTAASVSFEEKRAVVTTAPAVSEAALRRAISEAGYSVRSAARE